MRFTYSTSDHFVPGCLSFINPQWRGLVPYEQALLDMQATASRVRGTSQVEILGQEHPLIVTLGIRGNKDADVVGARLPHLNLPTVSVRRGGQATLHSPGQLVIYPVCDLRSNSRAGLTGIREFVELLKSVTASTLERLGLGPIHNLRNEPGLHTTVGKIAFFGLQVDRGVVQHGLSINVTNDLNEFRSIRSCGIEEEHFDRVVAHCSDATPKSVFEAWCAELVQRVT